MTEPEIDPEKMEEHDEDGDSPLPVVKEDQTEMDPVAQQEHELDEFRENISNLHNLADQVKEVGQATSEELKRKAQDAENEELEQQYLYLADTARKAYRRVEHGDSNIVRNGL